MKETFKKLIKEFHENLLPELKKRDYNIQESEEILVLVGLRRVGKTYLMFQKIKELLNSGIEVNRIIFLNFEDERLTSLKTEDLDKLLEAYYELYPENVSKSTYLFFDEIQAAPNWSLFLKRLYERKQYKIFVSGSSSKLLSSEIASELRGRTIARKIYTLSFIEFLRFKEFKYDKNIKFSKSRFALKKLFNEFLIFGGYPAIAKYENEIEKESLLSSYLELIIYKDLVERYKIRNTLLLKNLIKYFVTNMAKTISINSFYESIKNEINASKDAIWEYFSCLEDISFFLTLSKFSYSMKKQINSIKKVYLADNGFKKVYGFNFSEESGRLLENLIFIELKRRNKEIYYYSEKGECDFIIKNKLKIAEAVQVCYQLNNVNKEREVEGLVEAMNEFKLNRGLILTYDQEEEINVKNKKITVMPVWQWLLEEKNENINRIK